MKELLSFLSDLHDNNNREWFATNKERYQKALATHRSNVEKLITGIRAFDDSVGMPTVENSTYRIYRDTRFSADKTPYKDFFSAFIARGGKKSGYLGYYLHISPKGNTWGEGSFIAAGNVCPESFLLRSMREEVLDNAAAIEAAIAASGFTLDTSNALKRVPRGYTIASKYEYLLKQKEFCLVHSLDSEWFLQTDWVEQTLMLFQKARPFIVMMNRAIQFAYEEKES